MLAQQLVNALSLGGVYALFALGFTLIFGVLDVINLAHGAIFMIGAYAALQAVLIFKLPVSVAIVVAILVTGCAGWLLDRFIFKPLRTRRAPQLAPMIATIGVALSLTSAIQGLFGAENLRFPNDLLPAGAFEIGPARFTLLELQIIFLSLFLMALLLWALKRTQIGRAVRGVAESPRAAALLGINVEGVFSAATVIASALGGIAGVLIALYANAVSPGMGQPMLHKGIAVVILGGMGDIRGALIGGLFLGCAEVFSVAYIGSTMRDAAAFGLLFLILLIRPHGLFGQAAQRRA
jgi:branched-chain amino acid transport system permease protein